jgi:hypothetical protein
MMVVDSFFLLQFLFGHCRSEHGSNIKCMLENQIPLFVLRDMFDKVETTLVSWLIDDPWKENRINTFLVL